MSRKRDSEESASVWLAAFFCCPPAALDQPHVGRGLMVRRKVNPVLSAVEIVAAVAFVLPVFFGAPAAALLVTIVVGSHLGN